MARSRITRTDVDVQAVRLARTMRDAGLDPAFTLHQGSVAYKETNKLIIGKTNVWPDGMAGYSARDAYDALRVMQAALCLVIEAREESAR